MANTILEKSFIPIEYFYGGETISINGIDIEDFYPAICRAQGLAIESTFQSTLTDETGASLPPVRGTYIRRNNDDDGDNRHQIMIRLIFQPRQYFFSHTIEIVRQVHLLGTGSALGYTGGTNFKFPPKTGGIIVHNVTSGHLGSDFNALGERSDYNIESTFTCPTLVDRTMLGNGMQLYCGWITDVFFPKNVNIYNDALSINPQGSIIESIFFNGTNNDFIDNTGHLLDIYPEFRLIIGNNDILLDDRSSDTVLNNPYENSAALSFLDYKNKLAKKSYQSWQTASKGFHGMLLLTVTEVRSCTVAHFTGHGVYIVGNNSQNNDFTELNRLHIYLNNGNGLHIFGNDAGLTTSINLSSTSNAGWGIVHCGQSATNTFISCQASYNDKGGYLAPDSVFTPTTKVQEPDLRTWQDIINLIPQAPLLLPRMPQDSFSGSGIPDVSGNKDLAGNPIIRNGLHGTTALFLGCYAESNWSSPGPKNIADDNFINYLSILIGCTMGGFMAGHPANLQKLGDDSFTSQGPLTGFSKRATDVGTNPTSHVRATLGSTTYKDVALHFTNMFENNPDPLKDYNFSLQTGFVLQYDDTDYWAFRSATNMYRSPLSLSTYHNMDVGEAQVWLEKGLFLGYKIDPFSLNDINKRIRILTSTPYDLQTTISSYGIAEGTPKPGKGSYNMYQWEEGDVILNKKPKVAGNVGWICCKDLKDNVLKWYPYGCISGKSVDEGPLQYELVRHTLNNVDDIAGRWQFEGGAVIEPGGLQEGYYSSQKRTTFGGTDALNTASITLTLFFNSKDNNSPDNITVQGSHDFNSGNKCGSVSGCSSKFNTLIGAPFNQIGNMLTIG